MYVYGFVDAKKKDKENAQKEVEKRVDHPVIMYKHVCVCVCVYISHLNQQTIEMQGDQGGAGETGAAWRCVS